MSPRAFTVVVHLPAHVSDQEAAQSFYRILRRDCFPRDPASTYADGDSLEVHVSTISDQEGAFLRRNVFGADQ